MTPGTLLALHRRLARKKWPYPSMPKRPPVRARSGHWWNSCRGRTPRGLPAAFDEVFAENGMRVIKTPVPSPRANSCAGRFVGTLRRECLDHVLILAEQHLREVLAE